MPIREIRTQPRFERRYKKLPQKIKELAKEKEVLFRQNPHHPQLRTHKLHGKLKDEWAFWIDQKYRIKFIFIDSSTVLFLDIGTHEEVY